MKTLAIILFVLMYILMITLPKRRAIVALTTAVIFVATGILPLKDDLWYHGHR